MLNLQLDDWQKEILKTEGNICLRSGRQVGKSTIISILAGEYAINNPNKTIMVIAATERQAYLMFEKVLNYISEKYPRHIKKGLKRPTKTKIEMTNNTRLYCLPTGMSGYGIRGFTIDLLIADEAAFIPEAVWAAVTPMLATRKRFGARMVLLSTPFGKEGYFARCFQDKTFTKFHISSEECSRVDKDFLAVEKARMSKREYAQEYLGEFVDDLMQFFPDELIISCMNAKRPETITKGKNYYLGVDVARKGEDESTFEILMRTQTNKLIHVENQITTKTTLTQVAKNCINLNKLYDFQKIFVDDGGIGVGVFDYLMDTDETKRKTIPINNAKRVLSHDEKRKKKLLKEDLYNNLLGLMERKEIILLDDPEVFQSLKSVQYEYTSDTQGNAQLKIFGNYTHIAEGLIRAAWCLKYKNLNIWVRSIKYGK